MRVDVLLRCPVPDEKRMTGILSHGWGLGIVIVLTISVAQHAMTAPVENYRIRGWTLAAENCSQCHVIGNGAREGG